VLRVDPDRSVQRPTPHKSFSSFALFRMRRVFGSRKQVAPRVVVVFRVPGREWVNRTG
jgi:hypothetical protein